MNEAVKLQVRDGVATVLLNRPEAGNAIDDTLGNGLIRAVEQLEKDEDIRAVVLTGSGNTFCVGGDMKASLSDFDRLPAILAASLADLNRMISRLARLPVPVLAAVNGPLGGGGIALALAADLVMASSTAKLRGGYTGIGLCPDVGTSWFLTRRLGVGKAKRVLFLNESLDAETCREWGLFDFVHPPERFPAEVEAMARRLADGATGALALTKRLLDGASENSLEAQLAAERDGMILAGHGAEVREGVTAFLEKRVPRYCKD
ncbi:MAG: enoyl-CoA hydratase/isomerase family protein [Ectothiorhodospiraceae bacterium]|nr:enoyl-CoA hydratase/isomerase family protein [Ectothiorhodospiraceae bacterium]